MKLSESPVVPQTVRWSSAQPCVQLPVMGLMLISKISSNIFINKHEAGDKVDARRKSGSRLTWPGRSDKNDRVG
jgi:hypothetical protein